MKVLIADNNVETLNYLREILENEGFEVVSAESGTQAIEQYQATMPDFVCLDIMMPDMNGYDVCRTIRKQDLMIPIIFLSAKSQPVDRVLGLELGADDYITKPFDMHELVARMRAVTRRCMYRNNPDTSDDSFVMGEILVFPNLLRVNVGGKLIDLSLRETKILSLFYERKGSVISRDELLDECWGEHIMPESRTVDIHISKLRKRIEPDPKHPTIIKTVHKVGYRYDGV